MVLESHHAATWRGPKWFNEGFNKFLFVLSGSLRLRSATDIWNLSPNSVVHVTANTKHSNEDLPEDPVVVYVIHYHENILPDSLGLSLGGSIDNPLESCWSSLPDGSLGTSGFAANALRAGGPEGRVGGI